MLDKFYEIIKTNELNESNTELITENNFSDYELYQILEMNLFKPSEKNLRVLKEGIVNNKYSILLTETSRKNKEQNFANNSERLAALRAGHLAAKYEAQGNDYLADTFAGRGKLRKAQSDGLNTKEALDKYSHDRSLLNKVEGNSKDHIKARSEMADIDPHGPENKGSFSDK